MPTPRSSKSPPEIPTVRLQFVATPGIGSSLIRWFGHGTGVTHVDAVLSGLSLKPGKPDLLGARYDNVGGGKGVLIRPADYEQWTKKIEVAIPCTAAQEATFYATLKSQLGKPYDWTAIAAFFVNRDWRETDSWFCSELQAWALEQAGIFQHLVLPSNKIDPGDLLLLCSARVNVRVAA